jgi:hypothetical protein
MPANLLPPHLTNEPVCIAKKGHSIRTLEEWREYAPPKSLTHWTEHRSAMEVARAWLEALPALPPEVAAALATDPAFDSVTQWCAEPEVRVPFDQFGGERRNSDLLVKATDRFGSFVVAVEAKADESFGETIIAAATAAKKRRDANPRSRGTERLTELCQSLLGTTLADDPSLGSLRYQLLTATAGAIAAGTRRGAARAVLLLHEFRTPKTRPAKHDANAKALDAFMIRLTRGATPHVEPDRLYRVSRTGAHAVGATPALFVAKISRTVPA